MQEQRARFQLAAHPEGGGFEIVAMTAGEGNGWQFTPAALLASLALWDGVECFVDHAAGPRSLRDLAGLCTHPQWDAACQGIRLRLQPAGPSAALLSTLGREMLAAGPRPRVGFSADVLFHARGPVVQTILRVLSVDLVFNPARGGAFLRETNQSRGATEMETQSVQTRPPNRPPSRPRLPSRPCRGWPNPKRCSPPCALTCSKPPCARRACQGPRPRWSAASLPGGLSARQNSKARSTRSANWWAS